jgi:uncharacterized membrane protein YqjE
MLREHERPALPHLLRDLTSDVTTLVREEVELAKTELTEKASGITRNLVSLVVAGGVLFAAGLVLILAAVYGLTALFDQVLPLGIAVWLAPLVLAIVIGIVGYSLFTKAKNALAREGFALSTTAKTLEENKQWLKSRTTN